MTVYTIGFTQKTARCFFELIGTHNIELLLDIRLNNKSQLAGFTKGEDLQYFLSEICHCGYQHCLEYAPTKEILSDYQKKNITWGEYVERYTALIEERSSNGDFWKPFYSHGRVCLLCSEPTPERCHRRLLAELLAAHVPEKVEIVHI